MTEKRSAEEIRTILAAADPGFLAFADRLKGLFGARLVAVKCPGLDIGWDKWAAERAEAVTFIRGYSTTREARNDWKRIKAETQRTGEEARRKPSARQPGLLP